MSTRAHSRSEPDQLGVYNVNSSSWCFRTDSWHLEAEGNVQWVWTLQVACWHLGPHFWYRLPSGSLPSVPSLVFPLHLKSLLQCCPFVDVFQLQPLTSQLSSNRTNQLRSSNNTLSPLTSSLVSFWICFSYGSHPTSSRLLPHLLIPTGFSHMWGTFSRLYFNIIFPPNTQSASSFTLWYYTWFSLIWWRFCLLPCC